MGGTRMEGRVEEMDKELKELKDMMLAMGSKVDSVAQQGESTKKDFSKFMGEIREMLSSSGRREREELTARPRVVEVGESSRRGRQDEQQPPRGVEEMDRQDLGLGEPPRRELGLGFRRLDLPPFSGREPLVWVAKVERYFLLNAVTETEKVAAALLSFEGPALGWLQYREARRPLKSWRQLKSALLQRFGSSQFESPQEELINLYQETTVAAFREKFEALSAIVGGVDDECLKGVFLAGLKPGIRAEVKLFKPDQLDQLMDLAQDIEAKNLALVEQGAWTQPAASSSSFKIVSQSFGKRPGWNLAKFRQLIRR